MHIKFETNSNRVKGICFHSKRPWIISSLHNGLIQLYDYEKGTLINTFDEHYGPVRGIDFHDTQPLFVSGGDDYQIKVWNFISNKCLFTLLGHVDYIRTVQFHKELPWIISASDDQTIRIWNWQSRMCLSVITGHNHYVMCAKFHPTEDIIISASLDETIRIWDISELKNKTPPLTYPERLMTETTNELFGNNNVSLSQVLEGHTRGVNWVDCHTKLPLIVSASDDREIKIWRMNNYKAWEVDSKREHTNNVSCVIFPDKYSEIIVSNSEDRSVKIWNLSNHSSFKTYNRKNDRFWILATHPEHLLVASGHDNGFIVFKIRKERPIYYLSKRNSSLYYCKDKTVFKKNINESKSYVLFNNNNDDLIPCRYVTKIIYNSYSVSDSNKILLISNYNGKYSYILYRFEEHKDVKIDANTFTGKSYYNCPVFVSRNRFVIVNDNNYLCQRNMYNETKKKTKLEEINEKITNLFSAGLNRIAYSSGNRLVLYDVAKEKKINEIIFINRARIKDIIYSDRYYAILRKHNIIFTDSNFIQITAINEKKIKSGIWDGDVFIYSTLQHLKYSLMNGEHNLLCTTKQPLYLTNINKNIIYAINRQYILSKIKINPTEYQLKSMIEKKDYSEIMKCISSDKLVGKNIIGYLIKKNFTEGALNFNISDMTKFELALRCGKIRLALELAKKLDKKILWERLADEAIKEGIINVAEIALLKTKNIERLSFLYFITGNENNQKKIMDHSKKINNVFRVLMNSLYLGDIEMRIDLLKESGFIEMAYLTAKTYGLDKQCKSLENQLGKNIDQIDRVKNDKLLIPPVRINVDSTNWPKYKKEIKLKTKTKKSDSINIGEYNKEIIQPENKEYESNQSIKITDNKLFEFTEGWLSTNEPVDNQENNNGGTFFFPNLGLTYEEKLMKNSSMTIYNLILANSIDLAMKSLHNKFGVINYKPLKFLFVNIRLNSFVKTDFIPNLEKLNININKPNTLKPLTLYTIEQCEQKLIQAYDEITKFNYKFSLPLFKEVLYTIIILDLHNKKELIRIKKILEICREYIKAIRLILRKPKENNMKSLEICICYTLCTLKPIHIFIGLLNAIQLAKTLKTYYTLKILCKNLLELSVSINDLPPTLKKTLPSVTNILKTVENYEEDENKISINLKKRPVICNGSFKEINSRNYLKCSYCQAVYSLEYDKKLCEICDISVINKRVSGFGMKME